MTGGSEAEIVARWKEVERKVLLYAPLEERASIKKVLRQYDAVETENEGTKIFYPLIIVPKIK